MSQPDKNSVEKHHLRGSTLLFVGRLVAVFINFAVQIVTVRYLPKSDYGAYALAMSYIGFGAVVGAFGMDKTASRYLPLLFHGGDQPAFRKALRWMLSTVAAISAAIIAIVLAVFFLGQSLPIDAQTQAVLAILVVLVLCNALDALFVSIFAVIASPSVIFFRRHLVGPLLRLIGAAVVIACGGNVFIFAGAQAFAALLGLAIYVAMFVRFARRNHVHQNVDSVEKQPHSGDSYSEDPVSVREMYGYSATLVGGDLAFLLRSAFVPILIGWFFSVDEVAAYQAVLPIARLNELVLVSFSVLFIPSASRLFAAGDHAKLEQLYGRTILWITVLSFPIFALSFAASSVVPGLLFGAAYQQSSTILALLAVGFFANAVFGVNLRLLRAVASLRTLITIDTAITIVAIVLNFWLIPQYGALGGATAVCGTYVFQALIYQIGVNRTTNINPFAVGCISPFFIAIVLAVVLQQTLLATSISPIIFITIVVLASSVVAIYCTRHLELGQTFPELGRLPLLKQWLKITDSAT